MRLAALVLAIGLAGCGGSKPAAPKKDGKPHRERQVDRAIRDLDKTHMPEDMKRELREAKKLLDESK